MPDYCMIALKQFKSVFTFWITSGLLEKLWIRINGWIFLLPCCQHLGKYDPAQGPPSGYHCIIIRFLIRPMFSGLPNPDPSIIKQKISKKNLDSYCFCDFFMTFYLPDPYQNVTNPQHCPGDKLMHSFTPSCRSGCGRFQKLF